MPLTSDWSLIPWICFENSLYIFFDQTMVQASNEMKLAVRQPVFLNPR
jgi:hypothetical protein